MHLLKNRSLHFYLGFVLILTLALGGTAVAAFADSSTGATVTVNAGTLTETGPSSAAAGAVTLSGSDQTTTYSLGLTVIDARGSGAGWNLTITSTTFSTSGGTHSLSTTASTINAAPSVGCNSGSTCTNPTNGVSYPLTVPAASTAPTAVKFFNATANTGMASFTVTPTVTVAIPANTFAGTYTSTVSVAIVSGP